MKPLKKDSPTPLLLVIASFDPSGEGKDHFDAEHPELLTDKSSKYYGEQWAMSKPEDYYKIFFSDEHDSLKRFYKEMSGGKFCFAPAHIDRPQKEGAPDGVLEIALPLPHPAALRNLEGYDNASAAHKVIHDIVKACDEYIDFEKYDLNGDGMVTPDEFAIIILNAGYDHSSQRGEVGYDAPDYENAPDPRHRFMVHGTSQHIDVDVRGGVRLKCFSNTGEYRNINMKYPVIGVAAHELAHNLGAQDMYSRYTPPQDEERHWPTPRHFSLMCNGNHIDGGLCPSYIDAYQRIYFGWANTETADDDGIYTLYSTLSSKYNIIKITTPNPNEYFLCEIRIKEGFERHITDDDSHGGVIVWHIDEKVNDEWFLKAQCVSSNRPNGKRHDLGNALLPREGFTKITDENGNFVKFGPMYADDGVPAIPFFYKSEDEKTSSFDSNKYCGAASLSYSLNEFPEGVSKDWNLHIDVLDPAGAEMRIKITRTKE
ncbi:MAG: immune inhibitor A domain-containing protein [Eubacteriales bacterium]